MWWMRDRERSELDQANKYTERLVFGFVQLSQRPMLGIPFGTNTSSHGLRLERVPSNTVWPKYTITSTSNNNNKKHHLYTCVCVCLCMECDLWWVSERPETRDPLAWLLFVWVCVVCAASSWNFWMRSLLLLWLWVSIYIMMGSALGEFWEFPLRENICFAESLFVACLRLIVVVVVSSWSSCGLEVVVKNASWFRVRDNNILNLTHFAHSHKILRTRFIQRVHVVAFLCCKSQCIKKNKQWNNTPSPECVIKLKSSAVDLMQGVYML